MAADQGVVEGRGPSHISHWRLLMDQAAVLPEIVHFPYSGSGTDKNPFVVTWTPNDPRDPYNFFRIKKLALTFHY